jgi:glutamine amidotransferase
MLISLVDYGMGNVSTLRTALLTTGAEVRIATHGDQLGDEHAIVLPGVGAFGDGMRGLRERGFLEPLALNVRERRKPFLGVCLGMQLLADRGFELGEHQGLGWVSGEVRRLEKTPSLRVPQMGWNHVVGRGPLFEGVPPRSSFYFVHGFHFVPADESSVCAWSEYGIRLVAALEQDNVFALQFHPEMSDTQGLRILRNFAAIASVGTGAGA